MAHLGLSSIYLYNCRKLLQFRQRGKRCKTQKSGASDLKNQAETPHLLVKIPRFAILWKRHLWKTVFVFGL